MNNFCVNCGNKLENNLKCNKCNYLNGKRENFSNKKIFKRIITIIILIITVLFALVLYKYIKIYFLGEKYIIPELTKNNIIYDKVKYINREQCTTSYRLLDCGTWDGSDCGLDVPSSISNCYIYKYSIIEDNIYSLNIYLNENNKVFNIKDFEIYAKDYYKFKKYLNDNLNYNYSMINYDYEPEGTWIDNKYYDITIKANEDLYKIVDDSFVKNIIGLNEFLSSFNLRYKINFYFKDNYELNNVFGEISITDSEFNRYKLNVDCQYEEEYDCLEKKTYARVANEIKEFIKQHEK